MRALWMIPLRLLALVALIPAAALFVALMIPAYIMDLVLMPWSEDGTCWCLAGIMWPMMMLAEWID